MTVCGTCGHATPGQTLYCQSCGRSFNGRLCPAKHSNAISAGFCGTCGSDELSTPTRGRRITIAGPLVRLLAWPFGLKLFVLFLVPLSFVLLRLTLRLTSFVLGTDARFLLVRVLCYFTIWAVIWLILRLGVGEGSRIFKAYERGSLVIARLLVNTLKSLWRLIGQWQRRDLDQRRNPS